MRWDCKQKCAMLCLLRNYMHETALSVAAAAAVTSRSALTGFLVQHDVDSMMDVPIYSPIRDMSVYASG